jgi:uncharacterized protein YkwD
MKIIKKISILTIFATLFISSMVSAKMFLPQYDVSKSKSWIIRFNLPVNEASTVGNIGIALDKTGAAVRIDTLLSDDRKNLTIVPKENYIQGESYTLTVNTKVQSGNSFLKEDSILKFTIKRDIISEVTKDFSASNIQIGDDEAKVIEVMGQPARKDISQYGFSWYIYNKDYKNYVQIGIGNGKVVGLYTNTEKLLCKSGIKIGTIKSEVERIYDASLIYADEKGEYGIYGVDDYEATIFYDIHNNNTVTGVQLIDKTVEKELSGHYGQLNDEVRKGYEMEIFDLANAVRVRMGKIPYKWDDKIAQVARNHSADMANKSYFDHTNLEGQSPFDRMDAAGISFSTAAENIAAGQASAIFAHEAWMNSKGHRANILGDCEKLGVGVYFGGDYYVYYAQNFFTES